MTIVTTTGNKQVTEIIEKRVAVQGARLLVVGKTLHPVGMLGEFQKENGGVAEAVCLQLGVSDDAIATGLREARWPGRVEWFEKNILVDCAHNPMGIKALSEYVSGLEYDKLVVLFAVTLNKDYKRMLNLLPECDELVCTESTIERKVPVEDIDVDCVKIKDFKEAYEYCKNKVGEKDLLLVCGSIFLVGDLKVIKLLANI
ncbi:glutamate ligase domain-containing protein [Nanoarchaeota archaeon]